MKQFLIINVCMGIFIFFLFACSNENDRRGRFTPAQRAEELKERLDLTADQAKKIEKIYQDSQEKFAKLREDFSGDRSEMRESARRIMEETDTLIKEVLNEEQIEKYEQYRQERRERGGQRPRARDSE
jgi:Spy/CpxP family protein refolding chaperone